MTSPARKTQIRFHCDEPFKGFASIDGTATLTSEGVLFEYAMTQSTGPKPRGAVSRLLPYPDLTCVELRNHWISCVKIRFRARSAKAIESFPTTDPGAFEIEVSPTMKLEAEAFVQEVNSRCLENPVAGDSAV